MARKIRIEYAGAFYHVINRGNYRSVIFRTEGARGSFLECLQLASACLVSDGQPLSFADRDAEAQPGSRDEVASVDLRQSLPEGQWACISGPLPGHFAGGRRSEGGAKRVRPIIHESFGEDGKESDVEARR